MSVAAINGAQHKLWGVTALDEIQKSRVLALIYTEPDKTLSMFETIPDDLLGATLAAYLVLRQGDFRAQEGGESMSPTYTTSSISRVAFDLKDCLIDVRQHAGILHLLRVARLCSLLTQHQTDTSPVDTSPSIYTSVTTLEAFTPQCR